MAEAGVKDHARELIVLETDFLPKAEDVESRGPVDALKHGQLEEVVQFEAAQPLVRSNLWRLDERAPCENSLGQANGTDKACRMLLKLRLGLNLVIDDEQHRDGDDHEAEVACAGHITVTLAPGQVRIAKVVL